MLKVYEDMQAARAERREQPGRGRRGESGQSRAETRAVHNKTRSKELLAPMHQKEKQAVDGGKKGVGEGKEHNEEEELRRGRRRCMSSGDGGRRREAGQDGTGRRAASGERDRSSECLRWRVNQLEKEKLEQASNHNEEVCRLQAELTRLRSSVERGEAQRVELQYQLTVSQRDADLVGKLGRDKQELTVRAAELQQTVQELQGALDITRRAREEDQHALQQEVEERDRLIHSFGSENQRLQQLLQDHEEALEDLEKRIAGVQKEREKEAEVNRRQADELKHLWEREERSRREKELSDQRVKSLESSVEAERATHRESKFKSELIQLRVRDLEVALTAERSGHQEAQSDRELLRAKFREVERAYALERERSVGTERALERLQTEQEQYKREQSVAMETERKTTSELSERLEEERRQHANTHSLLEQMVQRQSGAEEVMATCMRRIRETLREHGDTGCCAPAKDDGNQGPPAEVLQSLKATLCTYQHKLEEAKTQVQDLLLTSERQQQEEQTLRELTSEQSRRLEESQQVVARLEQETTRLRQEKAERSAQIRDLQAELQKEREERTDDVQTITDNYQKESKARLSFLYRLYQRLLAGCVLLDQPQSILGDFTWEELCDVLGEQVDQLTSDLQKAKDKVAHLQHACERKSACVRELQRSQESALSRLEASVRRREEAWSSRHTHAVSQLQSELQVCRSQCDSLRDHVSSVDLHCSSLASDLSRRQALLSRSRWESASFFLACALLAGALKHTSCRVQMLSDQKNLLSRQLVEREALEEEVKRLADALGGDKEETEDEEGRRRRAVRRRWRRSVCVVLAVRRWCALAKKTAVLFRLDRGGGGFSVSVWGELTMATQKGQDISSSDEGREEACARWLLSKCLSSTILSSMADLQGALARTGPSHQNVISAARSALSRLLDHLLHQDKIPLTSCRVNENAASGRPRPLQPDVKGLVSTLQQHFLLFSQRLHSAEVERRGLRLEVATLKKGLRQEREDTCTMAPAERFHSVCDELRQALSREQEAQALIQEQTNQLRTLELRVNAQASEETNAQQALSNAAQALSEARREVSRKERSLRILGKHLSGFQKERKQLEERLQRAEDELRDVSRRKDFLISYMKAAETSYKEVSEGIVQSERPLLAQLHPLLLPRQQLELSGAECIMGIPEAAACQSLLSVVSQLFHACSSRIDWLEQEVSAHRSHVIALRGELQDACLRDNLAFVPVEISSMKAPPSVASSDLSDAPIVGLSTAASKPKPTPSSPLSNPPAVKKKTKPTKKNKAGRR